jgi:hypothetical protein
LNSLIGFITGKKPESSQLVYGAFDFHKDFPKLYVV